NSARMDTIENDLFPTANNAAAVGLAAGSYAGMYHESDPKFLTLGITKYRCAMTIPTGATNSTNILCDGTNYAAYGVGSGFDWADRRGDERVWVGIADTIGATSGSYVAGMPSGRWGAHNGWHARGDQDLSVLDDGTIALDPSIAVYSHGGQPGTIWDMFGVKA